MTLEGPDGPVPLADIFDGRNQLVVYKHMWHLGKPFENQCPGCTAALWDFHNEAYLLERGINFAVFGEGPYAELAPYREFMATVTGGSPTTASRTQRSGAAAGSPATYAMVTACF